MQRRQFLKWLAAGGAVTTTLSLPALLQAESGLLDLLTWRLPSADDSLLGATETIIRNAKSLVGGFVHGYGLALHEILENKEQSLPTEPHRPHASWPHIHCLCHCVATAGMEEDGVRWSLWGGIQDELSQVFWANLFRTSIYPLIYTEQAKKHISRGTEQKFEHEFGVIMKYLFGDDTTRKKMIALVGIRNPAEKRQLQELRELVYPLIDASESAWQRSDFLDNAIGRAGGCQCPKKLSAGDKVTWCRKWCVGHGIPSDAPEGAGTTRPWGPFHPLDPGPVPTLQETLIGDLAPPFGGFLSQPHPAYAPPRELLVPQSAKLIAR